MGDRPLDAFGAALAALRRKELASGELRVLLGRRGYGPDEVETAIGRLIEAGELDDEQFVRRYAEDKRALRGWGPERIREALASRGVPDGLVELALEDDSEPAQVGRACKLLVQRNQPLEGEAARARALGLLTRRGFGYEVAHQAIREAARQAA
jgi:SOS response regulatory protein OraA/RecX